jgi:hypothetical protein
MSYFIITFAFCSCAHWAVIFRIVRLGNEEARFKMAGSCLGCRQSRYIQAGIFVNAAHIRNFVSSFGVVILYNAERIYPEVRYVQK